MRKWKKAVVFLLSLAMVLSLMTGIVLADETVPQEEPVVTEQETVNIEETKVAEEGLADQISENPEQAAASGEEAVPEQPGVPAEEILSEQPAVYTEEEPQTVTEEVIQDSVVIDPVYVGDNDELLQDYIDVSLGVSHSAVYSIYGAGRRLTGSNRTIYDNLKAKIKSVADGDLFYTVFTLQPEELGMEKTSWTAEELGVSSPLVQNSAFTPEANAAINQIMSEAINLSDIVTALLFDCPYDLYWYEKTIGTKQNIRFGLRGDKTEAFISSVEFAFVVAGEYADQEAAQYEHEGELFDVTVNSEKPESIETALSVIETITDSNQAKNDYQKLLAYKDTITDLVDYNYAAANKTNNTPYGNPWQLIWVFDQDASTKVVCEGYSKAFQYFCDLSNFRSDKIESRLVSGTMNGGTGAGEHMWNVVTMDDGENYLVDVTNCDTGSIGFPDKLFLKGGTGNGSVDYIVAGVSYQYDTDTTGAYRAEDLVISTENYDPVPEPTGTEVITFSNENNIDHIFPGGTQKVSLRPENLNPNYQYPELVINAGVRSQDGWDLLLTPGTDYTMEEDEEVDGWYILTFEYDKVKAAYEAAGINSNSIHLYASIPASDIGEPIAEGFSDLQLWDAKYEYELVQDQKLLPGWDGAIRDSYSLYVENADFPQGEYINYPVENVEIEEGSDDIFSELRPKENEGDSWYYRLKDGAQGTATLKITYRDYFDHVQDYTIDIEAVEDVYDVQIFGDMGSEITLPGRDYHMIGMVRHFHYDRENRIQEEISLENNTFEWTVRSGAEWTALTSPDQVLSQDPENPNPVNAILPLRDLEEGEEIGWEDVVVDLKVFEEDGSFAWANDFYVHVAGRYKELWPTYVEYNTYPGKEVTVTPELREYIYGQEEYSVLDEAAFEWEYDPEQLEITQTDESYEIKRTSADASNFRLTANWNGEFFDRWYNFGEYRYNIWLNDYGDGRFFSDQNKKVLLDLHELMDDPGLEYQIGVLGIGFWKNGGEDPETDEFIGFEEGTDYSIEDVENGKEITLYGGSIVRRMLEQGQDQMFIHVDVGTPADDPSDPEARGIWLCSADCRLNVQLAEEEYDFETDREMLPGWDGTVQRYYRVRIQNGEYPDGYDDEYEVTNVEVVSGEDLIEFRKDYRDGDETSEDYWWYYRVKDNALGTATLRVYFTDLEGNELDYTFDLNSVCDVYDITLNTEDGSTRGLPGSEHGLTVNVLQRHFDPETGEHTDTDITEQAAYEWALIGKGDAYAELEADGSTATLTVKDQDEPFWEGFNVQVTVKSEDEIIGVRELWFEATSDYFELWPKQFDILPGETKSVKAEVRHYSAGKDDYEIAENVEFEWSYDPEVLQITEDPENADTYLIQRTSTRDADIELVAEWDEEIEEEGGSQTEHRVESSRFRIERFNVDFEIIEPEARAVYTDGSLTLEVECSAQDMIDDGTWHYEYVVQEADGSDSPAVYPEGTCYTVNGNRITLNGQALKDSGAEHIDVIAKLKSGDQMLEERRIDLEICDPICEYQGHKPGVEEHADLLPGWNETIPGVCTAYVRNTEYPQGADLEYRVTKVEIVEDPDEIIESLEKDGDNWIVTTKESVFGNAEFLITFDDLEGQEQTCSFFVHAKGDVYWFRVSAEDGIKEGFPGDSVTLYAESLLWIEGEEDPVVPETATYRWWLDDYSQEFADLVVDPENPLRATVTFKETAEMDDGYRRDLNIHAEMYDGTDPESGEPIRRGDTVETVTVANSFLRVWPVQPFDTLVAGGAVDLTTELRDYRIGYDTEEHFKDIKNCGFRFYYDDSAILIRDATVVGNENGQGEYNDSEKSHGDQCTFKVFALSDAEPGMQTIHLDINWKDEQGRDHVNSIDYFVEITENEIDFLHFIACPPNSDEVTDPDEYVIYGIRSSHFKLIGKGDQSLFVRQVMQIIDAMYLFHNDDLSLRNNDDGTYTVNAWSSPIMFGQYDFSVNENYTVTFKVVHDADYTAVNAALSRAEAIDRSLYTTTSLLVLDTAVAAVVENLEYTEQEQVDAMAQAINDAIDALKYKDGWLIIDGSKYLYGGGNPLKSWQKVQGVYYYMDPETGAVQTGIKTISGKKYFLDSGDINSTNYGAMKTGWIADGSDWYYADTSGALKTGWLQIGTTWYYLDPATCQMATGVKKVGTTSYFFAPGGAMQTGWIADGNNWYYAASSGALASGWVKVGNYWYYMNPETLIMQTGWQTIGGAKYFFYGGGSMAANSWQKDGEDWYYLGSSGAASKGWVSVSGTWYYMDPETAIMQTGWQTISGAKYFFFGGGSMAANAWRQEGSDWYYLTSSGAAAKGWLKVGNSWYYFKPDCVMAAGEWYDGYWLNANGTWTYQPKGSWKMSNQRWWFGDTSGWYAKNETLKINGVEYTFDAAGYLVE